MKHSGDKEEALFAQLCLKLFGEALLMVDLVTGLTAKTTFPFSVDKYEEDSSSCSPLCVTSSGSPRFTTKDSLFLSMLFVML